MNDKEAIEMMQRCLQELRSRRAQIEHLSPLADAYIALRDVIRMAGPRNGASICGVDIIWTLEKRIRELEPKPAAASANELESTVSPDE